MVRLKSILIKVEHSKFYLTRTLSVEVKNTNLPHTEFNFRERGFFMEVQLLSFDKPSKNLAIDILEYNLPPNDERHTAWKNQNPKDEILELTIVHIKWKLFEPCLSYYSSKVIDLIPTNPKFAEKKRFPTFNISDKISINRITIATGYFHYSKHFKWDDNRIVVTVQYPFLFKELDLVKQFFHRILKKKTLDIDLTLKNENGNIQIVKAECEDIKKINADSIKVIKSIQFKNWKKNMAPDSIEGAFFKPNEENIISDFGNVDDFEKELLFHILENEKIRNREQLQYLSKISSTQSQLHITLEPQFGFVFIFEGKEMTHCIWELINSHATYVWSINTPQFSPKELNILSQEITKIIEMGREDYRLTFENTENLFFHPIHHKSKNNPMSDHFGKWRLEIEKLLI